MQETLPQRLPPSAESFVSGAGAGAFATAVTYPLDLLRTRFAAQGTNKVYTGLLASIKEIQRHEGSRGYFRGLSAAIGQIVPYMGLFFMTYEMFHQILGGRNLPLGSGDATSGILASVLSKTCVFPLDLVRKQLQVQGPTRAKYIHTNIPEYRGVLRSLYAILMREGVRGWYRGLTVSLIKAAPASAVTMWTYERTLHTLMQTDKVDRIWELYVPDEVEDVDD
jgi:solute carrier family 25 thiamine pyrophosphate transporter 19